MKTKFTLIALIFFFQQVFSQDISGSWKGELEIQGMKLPLIIHVEKNENSYTSTMDSPMQGAKGIAVDKTAFVNNEVSLEIKAINFLYRGKLMNNKIEGTLSQNGMTFPLVLNLMRENETALHRPQTPKPPYHYDNKEVQIKNETEGNILAGTLTTPPNFNKNSPAFVMITGSGPQDRNSEIFGHQSFLVISDYLAKKGIATLRLDDRGTGGSEMGKADPTSQDFAGDINSAVNYLNKNGFKNIGLIGHSEGGMIAPMVANINKNVKSLILLAAPGIPTDGLMKLQTYETTVSMGIPKEIAQKLADENEKVYAFIKNYKGADFENDVENFLIKLSENEFSAYQSKETREQALVFVNNNWFRYFIKYNPNSELQKIKIPVLALNGSLDTQITAKENLEGIKKSLTKAGNTNFKTVEIPQVNHLFQTAKTGAVTEYAQIEETISPKVLELISEWVLDL